VDHTEVCSPLGWEWNILKPFKELLLLPLLFFTSMEHRTWPTMVQLSLMSSQRISRQLMNQKMDYALKVLNKPSSKFQSLSWTPPPGALSKPTTIYAMRLLLFKISKIYTIIFPTESPTWPWPITHMHLTSSLLCQHGLLTRHALTVGNPGLTLLQITTRRHFWQTLSRPLMFISTAQPIQIIASISRILEELEALMEMLGIFSNATNLLCQIQLEIVQCSWNIPSISQQIPNRATTNTAWALITFGLSENSVEPWLQETSLDIPTLYSQMVTSILGRLVV